MLTNIVQSNMNKFEKRRVLTQFHLVFVAQQAECKISTMENQTPTAGLQPWPKVDFKMQKSQWQRLDGMKSRYYIFSRLTQTMQNENKLLPNSIDI